MKKTEMWYTNYQRLLEEDEEDINIDDLDVTDGHAAPDDTSDDISEENPDIDDDTYDENRDSVASDSDEFIEDPEDPLGELCRIISKRVGGNVPKLRSVIEQFFHQYSFEITPINGLTNKDGEL